MKTSGHIIVFLLVFIVFPGCGTMVSRRADIWDKPDLSKYKYVYVSPTASVTSVSGYTFGTGTGLFGAVSSESAMISNLISGYFMKHGFVKLPQIDYAKRSRTIIVNYGECVLVKRGLTYCTEVVIQLVNASDNGLICITTAEGNGDTDAGDVKDGIMKCLQSIFDDDKVVSYDIF